MRPGGDISVRGERTRRRARARGAWALLGASLALLPGCDGGRTVYVGADRRADADGGAGAASGPTGCLRGGEQGYLTLESGGRVRRYFVAVPSTYDATRAIPLVMGLHARDGTGAQIRDDLGLEAAATPGAAVFVYPDALVREWTDGSVAAGWQNGPTTDYYGGTEDLDFVRDLVEDLEERRCLHASHRSAVGWGWGGEFAAVLGCYASDLFDAVVPVHANTPYYLPASDDDAPRCNGTVAEWSFHGRGDAEFPLEFGLEQREFWLAQNGCAPDPEPLTFAGMVADDDCAEYDCGGPRTRFCAFTASVGRALPTGYFAPAAMDFLEQLAATAR